MSLGRRLGPGAREGRWDTLVRHLRFTDEETEAGGREDLSTAGVGPAWDPLPLQALSRAVRETARVSEARSPPHGRHCLPGPLPAAVFVENETLSLRAITIFKQTNGCGHYIQHEIQGRESA